MSACVAATPQSKLFPAVKPQQEPHIAAAEKDSTSSAGICQQPARNDACPSPWWSRGPGGLRLPKCWLGNIHQFPQFFMLVRSGSKANLSRRA